MSKQTGGKSENKLSSFLKKNIYYILMVVAVLAIVAMIITAAVMSNAPSKDIDDPVVNKPVDTEVIKPDPKPEQKPEVKPEPEKPKKVFLMAKPVANATIGLGYSEDELVFHPTQGAWKTHLGIDYIAPHGTNVMAVFDGKVKSVTEDSYYGTTMVIEHMDGFESVYKLLDNESALKVGTVVNTGDVIGKIGNNATFEVKQGEHMHFELTKAGKLVDPNLYFVEGDK